MSSAGQREPLGEGEDTGEPGGGVMRQQLLRGQHDHREHAVQISAGHVASATTRAPAGLLSSAPASNAEVLQLCFVCVVLIWFRLCPVDA